MSEAPAEDRTGSEAETTQPAPRGSPSPSQLPTRLSAGAALVVTLVLAGLYLRALGAAGPPALAGVGGALALAGGVWAVATDRLGATGAVIGGLSAFPVGAGVLVGTAGTALVLVEAYFPVESTALIADSALLLVGRLGMGVGSGVAVLGAVLGSGRVVDGPTLARYYRTVARTATAPLVVTAVAGTSAVAGRLFGVGADPAAVLAGLAGWLAAPGPGLHLASFALLCAGAAMALRGALAALPLAELADAGLGTAAPATVARLRRGLALVGVGALAVALPAVLVDVNLRSPARLALTVGPTVAGAVDLLTGSALVRTPLCAVAALSAVAVWTVGLLRRVAGASVVGAVETGGPYLTGAVLTGAAFAGAGPAFGALVGAVAGRLPPVFAGRFRAVADSARAVYGAGTVVVGLLTACLVVAGAAVLGGRLLLSLGYLSRDRAGYALAAGGLFAATVFAGTVGTPPALVLAGLVGSLFIWDAGAFAATLGREVGRHAPTGRAEVVHLAGTLVVGVLGAAVAVGARRLLAPPGAATAATTASLAAALLGVVLLVVALR